MKTLLKVLGVLVALVALLLGVVLALGAQQPLDHVASSRATFRLTPDEVWARLADFGSWAQWNGAFDRVTREPDRDGKPYWRFEGGFGPMPMMIEESRAPLELVTRIPEDAKLGFSGTWKYVLAPGAEGSSTLTVTETGRVESLLFRGMGALFMDHHDTMNAFLTDLGRSFGEETEPEMLD